MNEKQTINYDNFSVVLKDAVNCLAEIKNIEKGEAAYIINQTMFFYAQSLRGQK